MEYRKLESFTLGLDIGIASIGWSVIQTGEKDKLIDMGVRSFQEAKSAQSCRKHRAARRLIRRKAWRKKQLKNAFIDFGLLTKEEIEQKDYLSYTVNNENIKRPEPETIYHLRKHALENKISMRELLLSIYHICGTRGHFLLETIDFESNESASYEIFEEKFLNLCETYVSFHEDISGLKELLKKIFTQTKVKEKELTATLAVGYTVDKENDIKLLNILKLLCGFTVELSLISDEIRIEDKKGNITSLLSKQEESSSKREESSSKQEELPFFLIQLLNLYHMIRISSILKHHNYICEVAVEKLEEVKNIYLLKKEDVDKYNEVVKEIQKKMNVDVLNNKLRVIKNIENNYPNGLYVKEARAILRKQQEFYPERITNEFIEICISIIKARIPYFIGPLGTFGKNAWAQKQGNFKYSYEYSKSCVNEFEAIKKWKLNMISRCTYLPQEFALPKGSFVAETYAILNEINILQAFDQNENQYYLTQDDKIKILNQLFLKKEKVSYKDISELLNLKSFGTRSNHKNQTFKIGYSLYFKIIKQLPEYALHDITEIFTNPDKIRKLEEIILNINLFDEEKSKYLYFKDEMMLADDVAKRLSILKSNNFFAFSYCFIMNTGMNEEGQSLMEILLHSNSDKFVNEQMTIITNAKDVNGNPLNFIANKYLEKLKKNPKLSIELLMENEKPTLPISRAVIRSLNECFKVYEEIINTYGVPNRVVIETAKDLKDSSRKGEIPAKHFNKMKQCFDYLVKQLKEKKYIAYRNCIEDWDSIEDYLTKNKKKIELYIRQCGMDLISGEKIDINKLSDYEMDHILPRGFGDDSMDNLMLIHRSHNQSKKNRVPLEYLADQTVKDEKGQIVTQKMFLDRVQMLKDLNLISEKKVKHLSLTCDDEVFGFINRNLVDTRYIIKEFTAILKAYHKIREEEVHIVSLKSTFTSLYRKAFNFPKNREIGLQHHAHDASIVVIVDKVLSTVYPNYDNGGSVKRYKNFVTQVNQNMQENTIENRKRLLYFLQFAYKKAYNGESHTDPNSLMSQIKRRTPLYSVKVEKNPGGELFEATIIKQDKSKKIGPLHILGINNEKRIFKRVECIAVDFYKYTDKKGKKQHVAIHIPKAIVNAKGEINKGKYIKLIKEFYKKPELLDEFGNIKEYYFRLRLFKNDIVYDTNHQTPQVLVMGSMVKKTLEFKDIYMFNYHQFDYEKNMLKKEIENNYRIFHLEKDINRFIYDKCDKEILKKFVLEYIVDSEKNEEYRSKVNKKLEKALTLEKYISFLENAAYIKLILNQTQVFPSFLKRCEFPISSAGEDAQYIKVKSSILGIRYSYNDNGKLMITGPNLAQQKFSKIKKEKFFWQLSKSVL